VKKAVCSGGYATGIPREEGSMQWRLRYMNAKGRGSMQWRLRYMNAKGRWQYTVEATLQECQGKREVCSGCYATRMPSEEGSMQL
jgi:hypothetical protein